MKTVKAFGPRDLRVVKVPDPIPNNDEVLVAIRVCGICGSDKWFWNVGEPTDYVAGHEIAGDVVKVGSDVVSIKVGDRVTVNNVKGCGECPACKAGEFIRCPNTVQHMGHGFSEMVAVPQRNCLVLNKNIGYEAGCLIFDVWGTPYSALERAKVSNKDKVVVFGCGPIGLAAVVLAKKRGAYVIAVEPLDYRREAALRLGADAALSADDKTVSEIKNLTSGLGASVVIECSGKALSYQIAFSALKIGGTLISIGEGASFEFKPSEMLIVKNLNLSGTLYSTMEQGRQVQDLMIKKEIEPLCFVTHRFKLEELPKVFGKVVECADKILKGIVLVS